MHGRLTERYNWQYLSLVGLAPPSCHWLVFVFHEHCQSLGQAWWCGRHCPLPTRTFCLLWQFLRSQKIRLYETLDVSEAPCQNDRCGLRVLLVYSWEKNILSWHVEAYIDMSSQRKCIKEVWISSEYLKDDFGLDTRIAQASRWPISGVTIDHRFVFFSASLNLACASWRWICRGNRWPFGSLTFICWKDESVLLIVLGSCKRRKRSW